MSFFLSHVAGNPWFDEGRYWCFNIQTRILGDEDLCAAGSALSTSHRQDAILGSVEDSHPAQMASWPNPGSN